MEIIRINTYTDDRFSREALLQHGCFLADNTPYEIKIISDYEAVIWGQNRDVYPEVIEEFRFGLFLPMYWLTTTAPPEARAVNRKRKIVLKELTRETPETAASPA